MSPAKTFSCVDEPEAPFTNRTVTTTDSPTSTRNITGLRATWRRIELPDGR